MGSFGVLEKVMKGMLIKGVKNDNETEAKESVDDKVCTNRVNVT